jgi:hypothetical protein
MNLHESHAAWGTDASRLAELGVVLPDVVGYATPELKRDYTIAMDAQPSLVTAANSGIPMMLTTYVDPGVIEIAFAPLEAANILSEEKKGDWTTDTAMFLVVGHEGEVTSYGDYNQTGSTSINANWPQRQSYHFQTMVRYGEKEIARAGLARLNLVSQLNKASADILTRYGNWTYFYGVAGLQNYGLLNDPALPASLTPGTKANGGGNVWITSAGAINASANEVYADIQSLFWQLSTQNMGLVKENDQLILAMSPSSSVALTITNSFGVDVKALIKQNFPNIRIVTAQQYATKSVNNPEGNAGGNFVQLIAETIDGDSVGNVCFTEKLRAHTLVRNTSSWEQKHSSGTWGAVIKKPLGFSSMLGV